MNTTPPPTREERLERALRRIWLFMRIVYRVDWSEKRMKPRSAWGVCNIVWPLQPAADGEETKP